MEEKFIDTSGPAFPNPEMGMRDFGDVGAYRGLTMRDYFAGQALPAIIQQLKIHSDGRHEFHVVAYEIADAMLVERSRPKPKPVHAADCDVNDASLKGIKKPCNCGGAEAFKKITGQSFWRFHEQQAIDTYKIETIRHAANGIFNKLNEAIYCGTLQTDQGRKALFDAQALVDVIARSDGAVLPIGPNP